MKTKYCKQTTQTQHFALLLQTISILLL